MKEDLRHPSNLSIARLLLGRASDEERDRVEAHAGTCERCRLELDGALGARQRFAQSVFPRTLPAVEERLATRWRWRRLFPSLGLATAVAAAAAALLVARMPEPEPAWQVKGEGALKIYGRRGEHVFPVEDGARLRPGDQIRFGVEPGGARFALVASIDGRGQVSIYQPSAPLAPGAGPLEILPDSIVLDDAPGPERVFAVFSDLRLDGAEITAALRALGSSGAQAIRGTRRLPVPYAQASVLIEKAADP